MSKLLRVCWLLAFSINAFDSQAGAAEPRFRGTCEVRDSGGGLLSARAFDLIGTGIHELDKVDNIPLQKDGTFPYLLQVAFLAPAHLHFTLSQFSLSPKDPSPLSSEVLTTSAVLGANLSFSSHLGNNRDIYCFGSIQE